MTGSESDDFACLVGLLQARERVLLPVLERTPLRGAERGLERAPLQQPEQVLFRVLVQGLEQRLPRCEGRVLFKVQMKHREQGLLRF